MIFAPVLTYLGYYDYVVITGIDFLIEPDVLGDTYLFITAFIWLHLLSSVGLTIMNLIALSKNNTTKNTTVTTIILAGINVFIFTVTGILSAVITNSIDYTFYATTSTWIPFIIYVGLTIGTFILQSKDTTTETTRGYQTNSNTNSYDPNKTAKTIDPNAKYDVFGGATKVLRVYDEYVTLEAVKNIRSAITGNFFGGKKEIYYENMLSVQFKPASSLILGYIQFETANSASKDNFNSENSFTIDQSYLTNEKAMEIVDFAKKKIRESKGNAIKSDVRFMFEQ